MGLTIHKTCMWTSYYDRLPYQVSTTEAMPTILVSQTFVISFGYIIYKLFTITFRIEKNSLKL